MSELEELSQAIDRLKNELTQSQSLANSSVEEIMSLVSELDQKLSSIEDLSRAIDQIKNEVAQSKVADKDAIPSKELNAKFEQLSQANAVMLTKLADTVQRTEGIEKYLASLEELMRLIAANQLLDNEESRQ